MARIYANENFPFPAVAELRRLGHDVLTVQETGKADRSTPDDEVLAFAVADSRALLTLNRKHFVRLHRESTDHFGIIVCSFDLGFSALAQRIDQEIVECGALASQLLRIDRPHPAERSSG